MGRRLENFSSHNRRNFENEFFFSPLPGDDVGRLLSVRDAHGGRETELSGKEGRQRRRRRRRLVSNFVTGVVGWNAREGGRHRYIHVRTYVRTYLRT